MTTIVKVKNRSKAAKLFLEYIKTLPFVEVEQESPRYNQETEKAMKEARAGKGIIKTKNHEDLIKKLRSSFVS
jgi:antitoxin component of RelBE/YafQ-DinJ toxin-antitoxin module